MFYLALINLVSELLKNHYLGDALEQ